MKISKRNAIILAVIVLALMILVVRNIQYVERGELDAAAVNPRNGDIAYTYNGSDMSVLTLVDANGDKLFSITLDNVGKPTYHVWFDENDNVCVCLSMKNTDRVYSRDGTRLSQDSCASSAESHEDAFAGWEKHGSAYETACGDARIVYDYRNGIECVFGQRASLTVYAPDGTGTEIWSND